LVDGPLRSSRLLLVGSTDRVGPAEYNEKLGLSRAKKVAEYLSKHGVEEKRIKYLSVGKSKASPTRRGSPKDRQVDIHVFL
jgi:outer membrane protein OmpA-like peptidoglycan-associated protein